MPGDDERRRELRVDLPTQVRFNVLEPDQEFIRGQWATFKGMETIDLGPDMEGKEHLHKFLQRLDHKVNLILTLLAEKVNRKDYRHIGEIQDISESGLKILSPVPLAQDARVEVGISIPTLPYRTVDAEARVQWGGRSESSTKEGARYAVGFRFTDILPEDQDEIVRWIFQKQREEIRRRRDEY
jgi:c-di-GMP-binding flagellar brake protein YcgR